MKLWHVEMFYPYTRFETVVNANTAERAIELARSAYLNWFSKECYLLEDKEDIEHESKRFNDSVVKCERVSMNNLEGVKFQFVYQE